MSHPASLAVVSAPLPLVDRRALSQAWYSALHLAQRGPSASSPPARSRAEVLHGPRPQAATAREEGGRGASAPLVSSHGAPQRSPGVALERRTPPAALERKVVRLLERRIPVERPAGAAVTIEAGRVHVLVRRERGTLRVIALCPEALRERVERAVAHACYALAGAARC